MHGEHKVQLHSLCCLPSARCKFQHAAWQSLSFSTTLCSLPADLSSLTIPYDEEEEELYNDVGSSDSMTTASHNTTLNQDDGMEEDDIYEVFPGKQQNNEVKTQAVP